jgi:CelD/BcsL family acetyltransferase involved in cellulose biosynthesis
MLTGDDALAYIGTGAFGAAWKALHAGCPWATGCQHPDFVLPWYEIYRAHHEPVVLVDADDDGALRGLLTLALSGDGARLTGAGGVQAEYQGWIAGTAEADRFALDAMARLRAALPRARTSLKYLPPGIPLGWMRTHADSKRYCALYAHARPVMKTDEAAMDKLRRKKNHRQNLNRLNRIGAVAFERINGQAQFLRIFDEICAQYDFRQAALYRQTPFSTDPLKKRFYLELHRRGMLHATVLTVDDELVASHIGLLSKDRAVHLGLNTHAPAFAAHSPGHLLLALLGGCLAREQVDFLDLTPGGDKYKEQFASGHDLVFELTMCGSVVDRLRAQAAAGIRRSAKALLQRSGRRSVDVVEALEKVRALALTAPGRFLRELDSRGGPALWRAVPRTPCDGADPLPVSRNCLDDVFKYDDAGSTVTRGAFIGIVMKRLEHGCQLFSYAPQDRLLIYCWAHADGGRAACLPKPRDVPDGATVLFDLYVHRECTGGDLPYRFIERMLGMLARTSADAPVFYTGRSGAALRHALRRCGFVAATPQPGGIR